MTDPLSPTPLSEEADAIIGAFFSYARDNGECNLLTMKSTDPQYRCSCGFSEWNRRAEALRVALRQTPQSASWTLDLYVHTLEGIARGESNAAAFAHSALELARSRLSPGVAEPPAEDPLFDEAVRVTGNLAREAEIAHLREQERDRYREGLEAVAHIAFLEEGRSYKERLHRAGNYAVNAIRPDLAFPPDPPEEN